MEFKEINVNDIDELIGKVEIIDIREDDEFAEGSIKTAKHIRMIKLFDNPYDYLEQDKQYYLLCHSGRRSAMLCYELIEQGFNVVNLKGGIISYEGDNRS